MSIKFCTGIQTLCLISALLSTAAQAETFEQNPATTQFIDEMVDRHDFKREQLQQLFAQTEKKESILEAIARPAEGKPWYEYRKIFLTSSRIEGGVKFWQQYADILQRAGQSFGVDPAIIVAIIGVETRYGKNTGSYRVIDALSTLAFAYPPRSKFFRSELEQFLLLAREEKVELESVKGSYAGAMGYGQFIPSSYRAYAVDFDKSGQRDLWGSMDDIIGSVANYFHQHHWKLGEPVAVRVIHKSPIKDALLTKGLKPEKTAEDFAKQGVAGTPPLSPTRPAALLKFDQKNGPEYWLTANNFYVITRYNRSPLYAMAVYQLSEAIRRAYLDTPS